MVNNLKSYIQPTTQEMLIRFASTLMISIGNGDDPDNADAPLRQFSGTIQSLKY